MELILGKDLKMTNIAKMTKQRIKKMKMADIDEILKNITQKEKKWLIDAIKTENYEKAGAVMIMAAWRKTQDDVAEKEAGKI